MTVAANIVAGSQVTEQSEADAEHGRADLGMWVFLAGETLFFGVLFFVYVIMRLRYPAAFAAAGRHTDLLLGTINTALLLTSSLTMALAVHAAQIKWRRTLIIFLTATAALGVAFLAIKGIEYRKEYQDLLFPGPDFRFEPALRDGAELYFWLYFVTTGLHAVHLIIGIAIVSIAAVRLRLKGGAPLTPHSIEITGLYWHFVDLVWIFLYPCLYLIARS